jgi:hypothetical protein
MIDQVDRKVATTAERCLQGIKKKLKLCRQKERREWEQKRRGRARVQATPTTEMDDAVGLTACHVEPNGYLLDERVVSEEEKVK